MIRSSLDDILVLAVLGTLMTMIMLGLGYIPRPRPATLLWSLMFLLVTVASYLSIFAWQMPAPLLGDVAAGLVLGAPALVWSGLRADRGVRPFGWVGPVQAAVSAIALAAASGSPAYGLVYSIAYAASAALAAASVVELLRSPERGGGRQLPLVLISGALPIIAAASLITSISTFQVNPGAIALPDLKVIGLIVYLTCGLITLLALARDPSTRPREDGTDGFRVAVGDRLARAKAHGEDTWSLLAIALDDTSALRSASGESAYRRVVERFHADIAASFPADADIHLHGAHAFVLISRPDRAVRERILSLLERLSTIEPGQPIAIEFSASVGWASVDQVGYDAEELRAAAESALQRAAAEGGYGWERAAAVP